MDTIDVTCWHDKLVTAHTCSDCVITQGLTRCTGKTRAGQPSGGAVTCQCQVTGRLVSASLFQPEPSKPRASWHAFVAQAL